MRVQDTTCGSSVVSLRFSRSGMLYQRLAAARCCRQFPAPGRFFQVDGHRLHAQCVGEGSPVVLLESGIAASSLSWAAVQPEIAKFTPCVRVRSCRSGLERPAVLPQNIRSNRR